MFIEKVSSIDGGMRSKVNDVAEDGAFNDDIARRVDAAVASDSGSLAANVAAESRK
jgi:hypothetical protein